VNSKLNEIKMKMKKRRKRKPLNMAITTIKR